MFTEIWIQNCKIMMDLRYDNTQTACRKWGNELTLWFITVVKLVLLRNVTDSKWCKMRIAQRNWKEYIEKLPSPILDHANCYRFVFTIATKSLCSLFFYFFTKCYSFKNYEKCLLFYLKSSFRSWDIQIIVIFSVPFQTFQIQKDKWERNNSSCHKLGCINLEMKFLE